MIAAWMIAQGGAGEPRSAFGLADPMSSLTHLLAAVGFAIAAIPVLRTGRGHAGRATALAIYVGSVVLLFAMSGMFHSLPRHTASRDVLQRLDHASIFVLIAGTFTAVHGILFRGWLRFGVIGFVWVVTAIAIPLKTAFFAEIPEWLGLTFYLAFPWLGLGTGILVWLRHGLRFVSPLIWGGVFYTSGAVIEFLRWPNPWPGVVRAHELFHVLVIAGAWCHWRFCAAIAVQAAVLQDLHDAGGVSRER